MTVKQLIEKLQTLDQDKTVIISTDGINYHNINGEYVDECSFEESILDDKKEEIWEFVSIIGAGVNFDNKELWGTEEDSKA